MVEVKKQALELAIQVFKNQSNEIYTVKDLLDLAKKIERYLSGEDGKDE